MRLFHTSLLLLALVIFQADTLAQGFVKTRGKEIVDPTGKPVLLRGFGLGGWMLQEGYMLKIQNEGQQYRIRERIEAIIGKERTQEFYTAWLAGHTTRADIDSLKAWGFNSVRLPMHYNLYTLPAENEPVAGQQTWLEKGFALTDSLVAWCRANGLYLVLDLHAAPGGQGNDLNISDRDPAKPSLWQSEANRQKTIALWRKLAERYANEPTIIAYDLINEPNWGFEDPANDKNGIHEKKNEPLEKLLRAITAAIREVDRNHMIIIEGNGWGNNYSGMLDDGIWDDNLVLSFHKYWNFNNTGSIGHILDHRNRYNVPVWLGETGENSNVWFTEAIRLLESNGIGWAWWPLKKLGYNNPLEIPYDETYAWLADYWNGKRRDAPPADAAYRSLMQLAAQAHIRNNILHRDVIDAMMRQPFDSSARPFVRHRLDKQLAINAADFDLGPNGKAYFDKDTADYWVSGLKGVGNKGGTYRNDAVDIFAEPGTAGSYYVGSIEDGEWMQYTLDVAEAGKYSLILTLAAAGGGSAISIHTKAGEWKAAIPSSGGEHRWTSITMKSLALQKGRQSIRIRAEKGGFNLKSLLLKKG